MQESLTVSIVIPAKNEEDNISACLNEVLNQETEFLTDILVIDSGSTDRTIERIKKHPGVRLHKIPAETFGHGSTRNLGAELTKGKYIVFLNADAVPSGKHWLNPLIHSLENNPAAAGAYSRHLPKKDCHLYMVRDLLQSMPDQAKTIDRAEAMDFMLFSTVSCAIPRRIWETHRFNSGILIAEDQDWARGVLDAGYHIAYEPASMVFHSHNYTPAEMFEIKRRVSLSVPKFKTVLGARIWGFILVTAGAKFKWFRDILFILWQAPGKISFSKKLKEIKIAFKARLAGFNGRYRGWLEAAKNNESRRHPKKKHEN